MMDAIMDTEIKAFHKAENEATQCLIKGMSGIKVEWPDPTPTQLWFKGLKKYGKPWSLRELELKKEFELKKSEDLMKKLKKGKSNVR